MERFERNNFFGLPLSTLITAFLINLFLLTKICFKVINSEKIILIDNYIIKLIYQLRVEIIAKIFYFITMLGHPVCISILSLALSLWCFYKKKSIWVISIFISIIGSMLSMALGKHVYHIDRPHQFSWYAESYFTFPSGHATIAVSFYGLLFYYFINNVSSLRYKTLLFLIGCSLIGLIGLSRLYLGVHYLSDVLAGFLLGGVWLIFSISVVEIKNGINSKITI